MKVALGTAALTATGVAAAGATGLLPEPVADQVRPIVELVTPFEVPSRSDPHVHRAHRVATADDEGGPPATSSPSSPAGQAGTGPPTAPAPIATLPASVAVPPRTAAEHSPPGTTAAEPSPSGNPPGASAGSPVPETNPQPHGPPTAPGTVPGWAGPPPATPGSPPPGDHESDQAHLLGGPPGGQAQGGPGAGASGRPDGPGPSDDAGEGKPAATDVQAASTPVVAHGAPRLINGSHVAPPPGPDGRVDLSGTGRRRRSHRPVPLWRPPVSPDGPPVPPPVRRPSARPTDGPGR